MPPSINKILSIILILIFAYVDAAYSLSPQLLSSSQKPAVREEKRTFKYKIKKYPAIVNFQTRILELNEEYNPFFDDSMEARIDALKNEMFESLAIYKGQRRHEEAGLLSQLLLNHSGFLSLTEGQSTNLNRYISYAASHYDEPLRGKSGQKSGEVVNGNAKNGKPDRFKAMEGKGIYVVSDYFGIGVVESANGSGSYITINFQRPDVATKNIVASVARNYKFSDKGKGHSFLRGRRVADLLEDDQFYEQILALKRRSKKMPAVRKPHKVYKEPVIDEGLRQNGTNLEKLFKELLTAASGDENKAVNALLAYLNTNQIVQIRRNAIMLILERRGLLGIGTARESFALKGKDGNMLAVSYELNRIVEKLLLIAAVDFNTAFSDGVTARDLLIQLKQDLYKESKGRCPMLDKYAQEINGFKLPEQKRHGTKQSWNRDRLLSAAWRCFFSGKELNNNTNKDFNNIVVQAMSRTRIAPTGEKFNYFDSLYELLEEAGILSGFERAPQIKTKFSLKKVEYIMKRYQGQLAKRLPALADLDKQHQLLLLELLGSGKTLDEASEAFGASKSAFRHVIAAILDRLNLMDINYALALYKFNFIAAPEHRVNLNYPQGLSEFEITLLLRHLHGIDAGQGMEAYFLRSLSKLGLQNPGQLREKLDLYNSNYGSLTGNLIGAYQGAPIVMALKASIKENTFRSKIRFAKRKLKLDKTSQLVNLAVLNFYYRLPDVRTGLSADALPEINAI